MACLYPLPHGVTREDAIQDAYAQCLKRLAEGYPPGSARLWKRVWGDLKDQYGRVWRDHYRQQDCASAAGRLPVGFLDAPKHDVHDSGGSLPRADGSFVLPAQFTADRAQTPPDQSIVMDVRDAVAKLTEPQRYVVEQCGLLGRPQADVAAERGVTTQAVKIMFMRARRRLAELLVDYAPDAA